MKRRAVLIIAVVPFLLAWPALAADEEERSFPEPYMDYGTEELERDPPIVAGSGRIHILFGDFELYIEDGGVVLWVEPDGWRALSRPRKKKEGDEEKKEGDEEKKEPRDPEPEKPGMLSPRAAKILGPVIRELYAEGGVMLRRGDEVVKARRLFYNFAGNRAVILDAEIVGEVATTWRSARIPLVIRAERLYQVAKDELRAGPARITTCHFGEPHYEMTVGNIDIIREDEGYSFRASGNVLYAGAVPLLWFPYMYGSTGVGSEPLKGGDIGESSKYGTFAELVLGSSIRFGEPGEERRWGRWQVETVYRSKRGPGLGLDVAYGEQGYRGDVAGFYQQDRKTRDQVSREEIPHDDRGWARWRHRHTLARDFYDGRLSAQGEAAWISDRSFLREYFPGVDKEQKPPEYLAHVDLAGSSHAASITGRWQPREFQTTTEYGPRAAYDMLDLPLLTDMLGSGVDLLVSGEAEAAKLERDFDDDLALRGARTDRFTGRAALSMPFSLGPVRMHPVGGAGATGYEG
ncbi:MAG: LPS-assembly protein LptD, partial [Planctomycetota bacterium]